MSLPAASHGDAGALHLPRRVDPLFALPVVILFFCFSLSLGPGRLQVLEGVADLMWKVEVPHSSRYQWCAPQTLNSGYRSSVARALSRASEAPEHLLGLPNLQESMSLPAAKHGYAVALRLPRRVDPLFALPVVRTPKPKFIE